MVGQPEVITNGLGGTCSDWEGKVGFRISKRTTSGLRAYTELTRYPIVTVTSLPLSAPAAREAAALFV